MYSVLNYLICQLGYIASFVVALKFKSAKDLQTSSYYSYVTPIEPERAKHKLYVSNSVDSFHNQNSDCQFPSMTHKLSPGVYPFRQLFVLKNQLITTYGHPAWRSPPEGREDFGNYLCGRSATNALRIYTGYENGHLHSGF